MYYFLYRKVHINFHQRSLVFNAKNKTFYVQKQTKLKIKVKIVPMDYLERIKKHFFSRPIQFIYFFNLG